MGNWSRIDLIAKSRVFNKIQFNPSSKGRGLLAVDPHSLLFKAFLTLRLIALIDCRLVAHDPDSTSSLVFSINVDLCEGRNEFGSVVKREDYNYTAAFELGPRDGVLRLTRPLDRERVDSIKLAVTVVDAKAVKGVQADTGKSLL